MRKLIAAEIYRNIRNAENYLLISAVLIEGAFSATFPQNPADLLDKRINFGLFQVFIVSFLITRCIGTEFEKETWITYLFSGHSRMIIYLSRLIIIIAHSILYVFVSVTIPVLMNCCIYRSEFNISMNCDAFPTMVLFLVKLFICITLPTVAIYYIKNNVISLVTSVGTIWTIYKLSDLLLFGRISVYMFCILAINMCVFALYRTMKHFELMDLE